MSPHAPGRFEVVRRLRPVQLVAGPEQDVGFRAPYVTTEVRVAPGAAGTVTAGLATGRLRLTGHYHTGRGESWLEVTTDGRPSRHRSRRHGRLTEPADRIALTLTGDQVTLLTHRDGAWTGRARAALPEVAEPAEIHPFHEWAPDPSGDGRDGVTGVHTGRFGQVGLRDVHLVTRADGTPYTRSGRYFLTLTHAGPGFFRTAHCGVWSLDPDSLDLEPVADLYFARNGRVLGDHATHLVRDQGRWLVAASTWGDFDHDRVGITLASSEDDLLEGVHVLAGEDVRLPLTSLGTRVGAWDPHLTLVDGHWHLAFVTARRFFDFHPALARAAAPGRLDGWELIGAATDRRATEGTALVRFGDAWRMVASDGRGNPRALRARYPVFDLALREVGALDAPYLSNIPWPCLIPHHGGWLMVTFDGTTYGGELPGYGTHGDLVILWSP